MHHQINKCRFGDQKKGIFIQKITTIYIFRNMRCFSENDDLRHKPQIDTKLYTWVSRT